MRVDPAHALNARGARAAVDWTRVVRASSGAGPRLRLPEPLSTGRRRSRDATGMAILAKMGIRNRYRPLLEEKIR